MGHEQFPRNEGAIDMLELQTKHFDVTRLADGTGFGGGNISSGEKYELLNRVDEIVQNSPNLLVPVDRDDDGTPLIDDGCGDGRFVKLVVRSERILKRSLNRAKLFGGGVTMTTAALVGLGEAEDKPLNDVFDLSINTLEEKGIDFGGHTDEHAKGENCGCGAIDKAPETFFAALKFKDEITSIIEDLTVNNADDLEDIFVNYSRYTTHVIAEHPDYSGKKVIDRIAGAGKVIKQLGGEHKELGIVLNAVKGFTVNQKLVREETDDEAQIFAVDLWRLEDNAKRLFPEDRAKQYKAFLSGLVHTLAVAAVLTKGDLPVYLTQDSGVPAAAEA
jgi:hypothetical protein